MVEDRVAYDKRQLLPKREPGTTRDGYTKNSETSTVMRRSFDQRWITTKKPKNIQALLKHNEQQQTQLGVAIARGLVTN